MLVIDPAKRITIEQIMEDKWYTEGCENEPSQVVSTAAPVVTPEMHTAILEELEELGLEKAAVIKALNDGVYDSLTATYYLIADRRMNQPSKPPSLATVSKANPQSKISKATDLECLEEDESPDGVAKSAAPRRETTKAASTTPAPVKQEASSATTAQAPKIVSGRRRATVNTAPTNFTPEVVAPKKETEKESSGGELPPARAGRVPSASQKKMTQIASEFKDIVVSQAAPPPPVEAPPALPPIGATSRARAHTVATDRKADDDEPIPIDQIKAHLKEEGPRTARFTFSVSTTSTKEPQAVFEIVTKTLQAGNVSFTTSGMVATCKMNDIEFEIEVCKLPNLQVVGLRCKRLAGGAWDYKEVLSSLISNMDL